MYGLVFTLNLEKLFSGASISELHIRNAANSKIGFVNTRMCNNRKASFSKNHKDVLLKLPQLTHVELHW